MERKSQLFKNSLMTFVVMSLFMAFAPMALAQGPTLAGTSPLFNAIDVASNGAIIASYDQNIDGTTVTSRTFAVHAMQSGWLTETLSVSGGDITLTPHQAFKPGELVQVSATTGTLNITGTGSLTPTVWQFLATAGVGPGTFFVDSSLGSGTSYAVSLGDVNGDGSLDAFVANGSANKVWLNDGTGTFTDNGQSLGSGTSYAVSLGDVNGDGSLDAFVANGNANKVWLNDGSGTFTDSGQSLGTGSSFGVSLGDVDGDGDLDAVIANIFGSNKVWLNDGTGTFTDSGQALGSSWSFGISLGDVNNDGDLDAVVASWGANEVWLNDGTGTFTDSGQTLGSNGGSVSLGDVNSDGNLDVFIATNNAAANKVWLNDGTGTFSDSGQLLGSSYSQDILLGDVNGDGSLVLSQVDFDG